jgi:phosphoglycolate phosphatase
VSERWPEAVVFDLDGTLIDSVGDITDALNGALLKTGLEPFSEAEVRLMVGGGARVLVERVLNARNLSESVALAQQLYAAFMEIYQSGSVARTSVFDNARELLEALRRQGIKCAICTNKPAHITNDVLAKLGMRDSFEVVVGGTEALPKKPHPAMLLAALAALGVDRSRAVMVGDSMADVGAARAADVPVIVVSHGYSKTPADELGADLVINSLSELSDALCKLIRRGS